MTHTRKHHTGERLKALLLALLLALPLAATSARAATLDQAELDSLLAPVALYPDTVLSHLLIAATYPLEVIQADRWVKANPGLEGEAAVQTAEHQGWDPSVTALVAFPRLLEQMSQDLNWTQRLGDAFLMDEALVIASIQGLRQRAYDAGNLTSNDYIEVHHEPEAIVIEPSVRHVVYVPYYDTRVVYGDWWWPGYAPVYWAYPSHYHWHSGFYWSSGIRVHSGFFFSSFYWPSHRIVVVHHRHHHYYNARSVYRDPGARHWQHNPQHRRGVAYRHDQVSRHYQSPRPSLEQRNRQRTQGGQGGSGLVREAIRTQQGANQNPAPNPSYRQDRERSETRNWQTNRRELERGERGWQRGDGQRTEGARAPQTDQPQRSGSGGVRPQPQSAPTQNPPATREGGGNRGNVINNAIRQQQGAPAPQPQTQPQPQPQPQSQPQQQPQPQQQSQPQRSGAQPAPLSPRVNTRGEAVRQWQPSGGAPTTGGQRRSPSELRSNPEAGVAPARSVRGQAIERSQRGER